MVETASSTKFDFDFAVAGGGPAGASAAIALALRGHSVVLFERDRFPRFHIGESLLATANDQFESLGITERIEKEGFPEKWGARLYTHEGVMGRGVDFSDVRDVERPNTYQVCRERFDQILLDRAREVGVDVREDHRVLSFVPDTDAAAVEFSSAGADRRSVRVRAMVDATGRAGLLATKLGMRKDEPRLANIAVFSHFRNVPRLPDDRPNDIRIVARDDAGWFWVIPISEELTSVGVVLPKGLFMEMPKLSSEERLDRAFADTPFMAELMRDAQREWPVRVEKDFSYSASAYAGDRWILAGDAGSFLDPVFSTGVSIAMESGIEAAVELDRALRRNDFSARAFASFSRRQNKRFRIFRRFVIGFYSPQFRDLFFDPNPPHLLFRSVITVLAGRWDATLWTRLLNRIFFFVVALQKLFGFSDTRFRRGPSAGYPD